MSRESLTVVKVTTFPSKVPCKAATTPDGLRPAGLSSVLRLTLIMHEVQEGVKELISDTSGNSCQNAASGRLKPELQIQSSKRSSSSHPEE